MAHLDQNGVPILALAPSSLEFVDGKHRAFIDSDDQAHLLTGTVVIVDNPTPVNGTGQGVTTFTIGGETLDEALKSVVGAFDGAHAHHPPRWVASTDEDLARLLGEHYGCKVKPIEKVKP
jgi:hypothetical protein